MNIVAMGLSCPVGLRWPTACAAVRAKLKRFAAVPYDDDAGRELTCSALEQLDGLANHRARWLRLLGTSLREALEAVPASEISRLPVVLALPPTTRGQAPAAIDVIAGLREICGFDLGINPNMTAIVCTGSSGGYWALQWAREYIVNHGRCLVGAADSLIGARPLAALSAQRRLLTADNPDGVIPGEAAACVLLHESRAGGLARVTGLGFADEPALLSNDLPLRAEGVVAAARAALAEAGCEMHDVDVRLSDAAGESYHFKEQALLVTRVLRHPKSALPLWLPADSLGYTGAAAGLCGVVLAAEALACGQSPGPRAICFAGNSAGERAAVVVEAVA